MAHLRLEWCRDERMPAEMLSVDVLVGPDVEHLRHAGRLELPATEVNALDRLLKSGSLFEAPAHTYDIAHVPTHEEVPA